MEDTLKEPAELFVKDVHNNFGLNCSHCHGGNPDEEDFDLAKDGSFKGIPDRGKIVELCSSCHSDTSYMRKFNPNIRVDQTDLYWTSQHGIMFKDGDTQVAVCTDCHASHGILTATHPKSTVFPWNIPDTCGKCHSNQAHMKEYGSPVNQVDDYKQSVHAMALFEKKDLSAPVCNDCHGDHGAVPPEVSSIAFVCRQCHPSTGELFSQSPHKPAFEELEISECEACHGNHKILSPSDGMIGMSEDSVCIMCHDTETEASQVADSIRNIIEDFKIMMEHAEEVLEKADRQGVEVSESKFLLIDANTALIQIRNLVHSFSLDKIENEFDKGKKILEEVEVNGEAALKEAQIRKVGLIVATLFIILLVIALYLKTKQIEMKEKERRTS
jgi:predicted CXXCH cytochrome family protein